MLELLDQPFNVVHELYRIYFLHIKAMEEKREQEEKEKQEKIKEERESRRNHIPYQFAAKDQKYTPPTKEDTNSAASDITVDDLEDFIEEVTS